MPAPVFLYFFNPRSSAFIRVPFLGALCLFRPALGAELDPRLYRLAALGAEFLLHDRLATLRAKLAAG